MKAPIIIDEHGAVIVFASADDAEMYLEPIDVVNEEYIAYDAEGRLLELMPTHPRIAIRSAEQEPMHVKELQTLLQQFLLRAGISSDWLSTAPLEELVEKSIEFRTR